MKKVVIAVMVIDTRDKTAKPTYYQNVAVAIGQVAEPQAIQQIQQWVSEQVISAKMQDLMGDKDESNTNTNDT